MTKADRAVTVVARLAERLAAKRSAVSRRVEDVSHADKRPTVVASATVPPEELA
jgi:hypothetical protein